MNFINRNNFISYPKSIFLCIHYLFVGLYLFILIIYIYYLYSFTFLIIIIFIYLFIFNYIYSCTLIYVQLYSLSKINFHKLHFFFWKLRLQRYVTTIFYSYLGPQLSLIAVKMRKINRGAFSIITTKSRSKFLTRTRSCNFNAQNKTSILKGL